MQTPHSHELLSTSGIHARHIADEAFDLYQASSVDTELPDFDQLYMCAQVRVKDRNLLRKDMPVIEDDDLENVKTFLSRHKADFCSSCMVTSGQLHPLQQQIYLEKSLVLMAKMGTGDVKNILRTAHIYISQDNFIIDGHHRWLEGFLLGVHTPMMAFRADLPFDAFLTMMRDYHAIEGKVANI